MSLALVAGAFTEAAAYECSDATHSRARGKIMLLLGSRVLQDADGASVLVNDGYWRRMSYPEKQRLAEDFACAIAGVGKGVARWEFRSLRTGRDVGEWNGYRLTVR